MSFNFGNNLRKTINFSQIHTREFFKTDMKYLIVPFLTVFSFVFGILFIILNSFSLNYYSTTTFFQSVILLLVISFILFIASDYYLMWLNTSKSYHIERLYNDPNTTYKNTLDETKPYRLRVFIASIIEFGITFILTLIIDAIFLFIFILFSSGNINYLSLFSMISNLQIVPELIIGILTIPLQLYLPIMLIEKKLGYIDGIKRSFNVLTGWMNKLQYLALTFVMGLIIGFILQILFFGVFFVSIFGLIFLYFGLVDLGITLTGYTGWLVLIICIAVILAVFITFSIETLLIVTGCLNGQVYINLVHPELAQGQLTKQQYNYPNYLPTTPPNYNTFNPPNVSHGSYCTNCGNKLSNNQIYCPNCGQKVS